MDVSAKTFQIRNMLSLILRNPHATRIYPSNKIASIENEWSSAVFSKIIFSWGLWVEGIFAHSEKMWKMLNLPKDYRWIWNRKWTATSFLHWFTMARSNSNICLMLACRKCAKTSRKFLLDPDPIIILPFHSKNIETKTSFATSVNTFCLFMAFS